MSVRNFIGMSEVEMMVENGVFQDGEGKPFFKKFYNWQPCKFSGDCPVEKFRLGTLLIKGQEYCSDNPSIEECRMNQFLGGAVEKYIIGVNRSSFCEDLNALCAEIEKGGWER